jgi:hypothetical protein
MFHKLIEKIKNSLHDPLTPGAGEHERNEGEN